MLPVPFNSSINRVWHAMLPAPFHLPHALRASCRSWQSLPPPQDPKFNPQWNTRGHFDFDGMETLHQGSVNAIRDLCTYAVDRLQSLVDPVNKVGVNVFAGVSQGTEFASYLCRKGLHLDRDAHPERCATGSPLYNQTWGLRWPMSTTMWKFDGINVDSVTTYMKAWRHDPSQHLPNINSPSPSPKKGTAPIVIPLPLPAPPVPTGPVKQAHCIILLPF